MNRGKRAACSKKRRRSFDATPPVTTAESTAEIGGGAEDGKVTEITAATSTDIALSKKVYFESLDELHHCSEKWNHGAFEMDILLKRLEHVEWECAVDVAKNHREEFERLTEFKSWLGRELNDLLLRHWKLIGPGFKMMLYISGLEDVTSREGHILVNVNRTLSKIGRRMEHVKQMAEELAQNLLKLQENVTIGPSFDAPLPSALVRHCVIDERRQLNDVLWQMRDLGVGIAARMDQTERLREKLERESQIKAELGRSLKVSKENTERAKIELRTTADEAVELKYQLEKQRLSAQTERKNLEEALRSEMKKDKLQIHQLQQSLEDLRVKLQHPSPSEEALRLKQQVKRNAVNFEREKKAMQERHLREMEKANASTRRLQHDLSEAQHFSHDLERYRTEMREAREQIESLRLALREADDENREMKRSMDQLATDFERASVASANENRQLLEQLAAERTKVDELTEQIRTFTAAGAANAGPSRHFDDEAFKTFQDQVYVTVFANHDGYASIEDLLTDFREDHGIDGEEIVRSYGYDSLSDLLRSRGMASRISIHNGPNGVVYKGIPNETNAHLREAHQISSESHAAQIKKLRRNLDGEQRKVAKLRQEIKALHEQRRCHICMDRTSDTTFLCGQKNGPKDACGHVVCGDCAENWRRQGKGCHLCRGEPIFKCVKLFQPGTE